jgi:hypothetical protein
VNCLLTAICIKWRGKHPSYVSSCLKAHDIVAACTGTVPSPALFTDQHCSRRYQQRPLQCAVVFHCLHLIFPSMTGLCLCSGHGAAPRLGSGWSSTTKLGAEYAMEVSGAIWQPPALSSDQDRRPQQIMHQCLCLLLIH